MPHSKNLHRLLLVAVVAAGSPFVLPSVACAAAVNWLSDTSSLWTTPANWSSNPALPGPADDVTIDRGAPNPVITLNSGTQTIHSLIANEQLTLSGGTLTVTATMQVNNILSLAGGTLANTALSTGVGGSMSATPTGGTLSNVAISGDVLMNTTSANVLLAGTTSFTAARLTANNATLFMAPGYTLSSLVVAEDATAGTRVITLSYGATGTVTLSPSAVVRLAAGSGGGLTLNNSSFPATLVNNGLISAEAAGQTLAIQNSALTNNGTLQVTAGNMTISPTNWTNPGTVTAASGTTLTFGGNWSDAGTLSITSAILNLGGAFSTGAINFATFTRSGGTVNLTGTLDNSAATLALNAGTGPWNLMGGTINNGSVTESPGSTLMATPTGGTLSNVAISGDVLMNTTSANVLLAGTTSFTAARLTANNATLFMAPGYTLSSLVVAEDATAGTRVITLSYGATGTVTLSPSAVVRLAAGSGGGLTLNNSSFPATLVNNGLISAEAAGQTLAIQNSALTNNGTLQVTAGNMTISPTNWTNPGTVTAASGTTLTFGGNWSDAGTLSITSAILNLGGAFSTGAINFATFTRSGGTVNLTGTLDNSAATLALNAGTGPWNLMGGTINNGSVTESPGSTLMATPTGGTLSNVAISGDVLMNTTSANVLLAGTTSFTAARLTANNATLFMAPGYTLSSLVVAEDATAGTRVITLSYGATGTVTLSPSAVVRLAAGSGGGLTLNNSSFPATLVNNGLISAEAAGQTLAIQNSALTNNGTLQVTAGNMTISPTNWTNPGTVTAASGTTLTFGGNWSDAGTLSITSAILNLGGAFSTGAINFATFTRSGGTVNLTGTLDNSAATLALNAGTGPWNLMGGTINNGSVTESPGSTLMATPTGGTLSNVAISGDVLMNTTSANVLLAGTTSFTAARLTANNATLFMAPGYTLSSLVVAEDATAGTRVITLSYGATGTVTLSPSAVVRLAAGSGGGLTLNNSSFPATLVNNGLISAEAAAQTLTFQNSAMINNGTVQAIGGSAIVINYQVTGTGSFIVGANSTFTTDGLIGSSFTVSGTASIRPNGTNTGTSKFNSLTVTGAGGVFSGKLDLANNRLILEATDPSDKALKIASINSAITSGFNGGPWTGAGITSSTAAADKNHLAVAVFDNSALNLATFGGQPVDANSILVAVAHLGDANRDGVVDIQDQSLVTNNWQQPRNNWAAGDLNRDGFVNIQDLTIVTNNWQQTSSFSQTVNTLADLAATANPVPEPATLLLALPALLLLSTRRARTNFRPSHTSRQK